ncbi:tyrosine-protein phosphatase non-receptor type 5-like [Ostrea edulis]|uniref:tyrosine-protein phosphatase non-receptor type 5-like n=1 Tax=Ostrea edulis TaxID=37623 RepID=UPI00209423BF|nr:tyrosine-protein phosphatase non-receptor type 5-like [Ostrea edulis]
MNLLWESISKTVVYFGLLTSSLCGLGSANGGAAATGTSRMPVSALGAKMNFLDVISKDSLFKRGDSVWMKYKTLSDDSKLMQLLDPRDGISSFALLKLNTVAKVGREKRSYQSQRYYPPIPPENILVICLGAPLQNLNKTALKEAFASYLKLPVGNVCIDKILIRKNMVELYFVKSGHPVDFFDVDKDLIPVGDIQHPDLIEYLQKRIPSMNITIETSQRPLLTSAKFWTESYFPYVAAACSVCLFLVMAVMIFCCCRKKSKNEGIEEEKEEYTEPQQVFYPALKPQQIFYPSIKPDVKHPVMIQPEGNPVFVTKGCVAPVQTQAKKIKAKGLLERRGSSASLKIDLKTASQEKNRWEGTPPKEGTALEYLLTAGNRLSRRDLRNAVKNSRALYEEFWEIPMNHPEKVYVAGSGMKNRYRTIIPNEHSRVILPDSEWDPLSSYINANYIKGYEGEEKAYIATQGPMSHTIVDFWRMVWIEKSPIIVMITKLKEKAKTKCENYLPEDNETWCAFGDIEVKVDRVLNKQSYILRHLLLRSEGEVQHVLHYWYTAWPDHKPTQSPHMLLQLIQEVELRRYRGDSGRARGPVIVHCSAGIGRTGCFIAISTGMRQLREEHSVDVLGVVCNMRSDRGGMIQTHEQYEFIHQALCEYEKDLAEPVSNCQPTQ